MMEACAPDKGSSDGSSELDGLTPLGSSGTAEEPGTADETDGVESEAAGDAAEAEGPPPRTRRPSPGAGLRRRPHRPTHAGPRDVGNRGLPWTCPGTARGRHPGAARQHRWRIPPGRRVVS